MNKILKGKRILVTAGSTWVAIDTVRVITNIFKGKIGTTIAISAANLGADVTLLLGPSLDLSSIKLPKNITLYRFKYFDELDRLITTLLRKEKFDSIIHSAAVSDFKVIDEYKGKIKSNVSELVIRLTPTKKIIDNIRILAPSSYIVKFKLEVGLTDNKLIEVGLKSLRQSNVELVVGNVFDPKFKDHKAFLIRPDGTYTKVLGRDLIAKALLNEIHGKH